MDIEGAQIDFACPECDFINVASLGDAVNGASLICVGCLRTIQLVDGDGGTKRAVDEVNQTLDNLRKAFKRGH